MPIGMQAGQAWVDLDLKNNLGKGFTQAQSQMAGMGRSFSAAGMKMTKYMTVPILAAGAAVLKFGSDFEKAMTESVAIMSDVTPKIRKEMEGTAREVAKTTRFSAEEAAQSYFYLASAGLDAAQSMAALPKVAAFAQAGNFDMALATDLLTDAQSALGLTVKDTAKNMENMTRVSDVLVKANTLANATVQQFSEALTTKAGAALRLLGKDVEEGAAVLAVFADQGVKGAQAGEQLNIVSRDLQRAFIKNKGAFQKAGVAVYDSTGKMRSYADIVQDLEKHLDGMSDEQKRAALMTLGFQDRSVSATMALLGFSDKIRDYEKNLRKAGGTTDDVAKKQLQNFQDQLKLMKDRLIDVLLTLSESLLPVVKNDLLPAFEKAFKVVAKVGEGFAGLPGPVRKAIFAFVGVLAAIGPVALILGKIITIAAGVIGFFMSLATVGGLVHLAFAGLFALVAGAGAIFAGFVIKEVIDNWGTWKGLIGDVTEAFKPLKERFSEIKNKWNEDWADLPLVSKVEKALKEVGKVMKEWWSKGLPIKEEGAPMGPFEEGKEPYGPPAPTKTRPGKDIWADMVNEAKDTIENAWFEMWDGIFGNKKRWDKASDKALGIMYGIGFKFGAYTTQGFMAAITFPARFWTRKLMGKKEEGEVSSVGDTIVMLVAKSLAAPAVTLGGILTAPIVKAFEELTKIPVIKDVGGALADIIGREFAAAFDIGSQIGQKLLSMEGKMLGFGASIGNKILDGIVDTLNLAHALTGLESDSFLKAGEKIGNFFLDGLYSIFITVPEKIASWIHDNIITPISDTASDFYDWGKKLITGESPGLIPGMAAGFAELLSKMPAFLNENIIQPIINFLSDVFAKGRDVIGKLGDGIVSAKDALFNRVGATLGAIWDSLSGFIEKCYGWGRNIIGRLGDGVVSAADAFKKRVEDVLGWVAQLLPQHSDALEGPLSNLTASGRKFMEAIADGLTSGKGYLHQQLKNALGFDPLSFIKKGINLQKAFSTAMSMVGKPYIWGGAGFSGADCSGLVSLILGQAGFGFGRMVAQTIIDTLPETNAASKSPLLIGYKPHHVGIRVLDQWFEARGKKWGILGDKEARHNWSRYFTPMAEGGLVTEPTLALIGERGPEAVVPLSKGTQDIRIEIPLYLNDKEIGRAAIPSLREELLKIGNKANLLAIVGGA